MLLCKSRLQVCVYGGTDAMSLSTCVCACLSVGLSVGSFILLALKLELWNLMLNNVHGGVTSHLSMQKL